MNKIVEISLLFDFYGKLLTEKQFKAIDLYYMDDLSLSEIGDYLNVSRQGVSDLIKRAESNLYDYENELGLISRFKSIKIELENINKELLKIEKKDKDRNFIGELEEIYDSLDRINKRK